MLTAKTLVRLGRSESARVTHSVLLVLSCPSSNHLLRKYNSLISMLFLVHVVSPRCNRPLGMRGGAILDLQITASSALPEHQPYQARPHHEGWCAAVDDPKPYLQVKWFF